MFASQAAVSLVPYVSTTVAGLAAQTAIGFFVSAFIGATLARRRFVLPAAIVWAAIWSITLYLTVRIAHPAGGDLASVVDSNWTSALFSLATAIAGSLLGQFASSRHRSRRDRAMAYQFRKERPVNLGYMTLLLIA